MLTLTLHANGVAPTPDPYLVTRFDPGHGDQGGEPPLAQVIRSEKGSNHLPHSSQPARVTAAGSDTLTLLLVLKFWRRSAASGNVTPLWGAWEMRRPAAAEAELPAATMIGDAARHSNRQGWELRARRARRRGALARVAGRDRGGQAHGQWRAARRAARQGIDRPARTTGATLLVAAARSVRAAVQWGERHADDCPCRSAGEVAPLMVAASGRRGGGYGDGVRSASAVHAPCPGREGETAPVMGSQGAAPVPCNYRPPCVRARAWSSRGPSRARLLYACPVLALRMALGPRAALRMAPGMSAYVSVAARSSCGRNAPSRVDFVLNAHPSSPSPPPLAYTRPHSHLSTL